MFCWLFCSIMRIVLFVFFFFFKQKTAYEMRISDWSSDVCSSDLEGSRSGAYLALLATDVLRDRAAGAVAPAAPRFENLKKGGTSIAAQQGLGLEIGRASCRERVCQYV